MKICTSLCLAFLIAASASAFAAEPATRAENRAAATRPAAGRGDGAMMAERVKEMLGGLSLSPEQKKQIDEILDESKKKFDAMRQELANAAPRERGERVREFFGTVQEEIKGALSEEQRREFQKKVDGATERMRGAMERPGEVGERIKENLEKLGLSEEQKTKVKDVIDSARAQMQKIREDSKGEVEQVREKARELMQDTRRKLNDILDSDQQQKLRDLVEGRDRRDGRDRPEGRDRRPSPATTRAAGRPGDDTMMMESAAMKDGGGEMMEMSGGRSDRGRGRANQKVSASRKPTTEPALSVGAAVPELTLRKLDGLPVQLSSYKGRPVVLEFGSYSSPSFRQRAGQMELLKKEFGARATFLVVYTAEAHPMGGWEADRNKSEKIFMEPHKSLEDRKAAANKTRDTLKITIPIILDEMDDSVAKAFGAKQNTLVILRDGKVVARQEWADPHGARRLIENVVKPATTQPAP